MKNNLLLSHEIYRGDSNEMTEPVTPIGKTTPEELGQAKKRANRIKRRETMAKIEEQYQSISRSIESKFGDLNKSLDSVNEKFGKLVEQQGKISEIFTKNSTDIQDLRKSIDEKDKQNLKSRRADEDHEC